MWPTCASVLLPARPIPADVPIQAAICAAAQKEGPDLALLPLLCHQVRKCIALATWLL
jgi:hypothetical protein